MFDIIDAAVVRDGIKGRMASWPVDLPDLHNAGRVLNDFKPKQRRNKRTLNCSECVERKTKCDKRRPECFSCIRRRTTCRYSNAADVRPNTNLCKPIVHRRASADISCISTETYKRKTNAGLSETKSRRASISNSTFIGRLRRLTSPTSNNAGCGIDLSSGSHPDPDYLVSTQPRNISPNFQGILSHDPTKTRRQHFGFKDKPGSFNIFGIGSRHVFQNYWTNTGGLPEVISVLPIREQADRLVEKYFEAVDPLYPIIRRADFLLEYERFWSLPQVEMQQYDAAKLSLHFAIYAIGAQLTDILSPNEREHTADFYLSASHQSLCISSYLNCFSVTSIQTMVLICYFLVNNNHVSDAWTFSGITQRQAYGLELNRNPDEVRPEPTLEEKHQRLRLWQAIMFQDTSLSLYLGLPPSTLHYDIPQCYLDCGGEIRNKELESFSGWHKSHSSDTSHGTILNDAAWMRAMWEYASFVQKHICIPKSLGRSISTSPEHKAQLISQFRRIYCSNYPPFNSNDPARFDIPNRRLVRQLIAFSSSYFYVLTILYMDKNQAAEVACDVYGALDAAHEAMSSFFAHIRLFPAQVDIWGAYHTRAFAQAMMIGTVLAAQEKPSSSVDRDVNLMLAKSDFDRYLDTLIRAQGTAGYETIQRCRVADLERLREQIAVV